MPKAKATRTVNPAVAVLISLPDHLINLIVGQLLADRSHHVTELGRGDEAVVVAVKDLKGLLQGC